MEQSVALRYKSTHQVLHPLGTSNVKVVVQSGLLRNGVYLEGCLVITIDEAMKIFKVSRPTVYRWIKRYKIKSYTDGGIRYFDIDGLQNAHKLRHVK